MDSKKFLHKHDGYQTQITAITAQPTWTDISVFQNSWGNFGSGYATAGYYKDFLGIVHLKGLVSGGSVGISTPIFTLPVGYRSLAKFAYGTVSNSAFGWIQIDTNGTVACGGGSNTNVSLDGISFATW